MEAAVNTVPGAQYAGLSLVEHSRVVNTRVGIAELVFQVDEARR
ncbi:hypothetical protein ACWT_6847 [Actinoplanes sp. SE50]|nr:hypothetical protein ACPL_6978 [Actinoplanes sp. SE50/110]ATO86262.1 hypothetical protein ACWT_6847 [Actinoplanes sp. SE50]SLM03677.1 hypothetical protein ACSP50_6973 [Actinoplanes sp. SE50/110]